MTLRMRITLVAALAVGVAVVLASVVAYVAVRGELRAQVDRQLEGQAAVGQRLAQRREAAGLGGGIIRELPPLPPEEGGAPAVGQIVPAAGPARPLVGDELPVTALDRSVAAGRAGPQLRDVDTGEQHLRVLTAPLPGDRALLVGRSLDGVDHILSRLRLLLALLCGSGVGLAALVGWIAADRVMAPIADLSEAARHVSETQDLGRRIDVRTEDEVGQLAAQFNAMLDALDRSQRAQRRLVADASHELRTPVTSVRANIELLAEGLVPDDERAGVLADAREQVEELSALVVDLIELARGDEPVAEVEDVRLDAVVAEAVQRARRHAPGVRFAESVEPAVVEGVPDRLARAVNNLLDNAARHSPPGGTVEVHAGLDGIRVRDHGEGIAPEDLDRLFERFYRGAGARGRPGTGLGLAIVRQVAEAHGGRASAANAPGGGAVFELVLPASVP
jgi:two-component system, OmpR family, sensor histidine kinase MprB